MSRQLHCPNCGGEHTLVNPGIVQLVCQFCQTTLYWGDDQVLQMGEKSILPEDDTRLFMWATGQIQGVGFQVTGHLVYDHGRGVWHEWFLNLNDGREAWVSEDERKLTLEIQVQPDGELPLPSHLQVGMPVGMGGIQYTLREIGQAKTLGGEGQMPFVMRPGETYTYADCASLDGQQFATLEYDNGGIPTCFAGYPLGHDILQIEGDKPSAVESGAASHQGKNINCTNCQAPIEVPGGRKVETKICEYCGAQLDLTTAQAQVLGQNRQDINPGFVFNVGQKCTFKGKPYEVAGRMLYSDMEGYLTREYLLFNENDEYLWLAEENNHYVLNTPTQMAPTTDPFAMLPKQKTTVNNESFQFYEGGYSELIWVDGALPWKAAAGDTFQYADLIAPPRIFGAENDGNEVEFFIGDYIEPKEVYAAFGITDQEPRPKLRVHGAQPYTRSFQARITIWAGLGFTLLNLALMIWSMTVDGKLAFRKAIVAADYLKETKTEAFDLPKGSILAVRTYANLRNSWISTQIAFVDVKTENVVAEVWSDIGYYSGYEGGEHWSEGDKGKTKYFKSPGPGKYKLIIKADGGRDGISKHLGPAREVLVVRVYTGIVLTRYFLIAFILFAIITLIVATRKSAFESKRWSEVIEDDDDDDDWDD